MGKSKKEKSSKVKGDADGDVGGDASSLTASIIDTLKSSNNGKSMDLKPLRSAVLTGVDGVDKKLFKEAVKLLETDGRVSLNADGVVKLSKSERSKSTEDGEEKSKKSKKKKDKKSKRSKNDQDDEPSSKKHKSNDVEESNENDVADEAANYNEDEENANQDEAGNEVAADDADIKDKNKPCKGNPNGDTRLFLGNLPFAISEPTLNSHLNESITHIKWITDRETGKFYGSAFVEMRTSKDAAKAVTQINGTQLMGRPIKINYAPMRAGEEGDWPPKSRVITGGKLANAGGGGQAGGKGVKAMAVKPEGCCKLFIGNLSYDIDDDGITKFFMSVDAEVKSVRWLHHRDSGDFKGCGYVDFWNTEACEKAAALNGKNLLGRPIRIDWAE